MIDCRGTIKAISRDFKSGRYILSIELTEGQIEPLDALQGKDLAIGIKQFRNSRSKSANALLWSCLARVAETLGGDKWDYYLQALRKYGQCTLVTVKPEAVERFRDIYRECEVVGERNGMVDLLCYFGSSTYDTHEFSVLLDGVVDDMRQAGIPTPADEELDRALEAWEKERAR